MSSPIECDSEIVLSVSNVSKHYDTRPILTDISFSLSRGERLALTGPSGSGKTTLLNCLGGIDRADSGEIILNRESLSTLTNERLAQLRRSSIGTIFQFFHLLPTLTAFENIELPLQLIGRGKEERGTRVNTLLERINLGHRSNALPSQLSGGEQQRIAIARALVHRPALLLADEPTGNLDSANGDSVLHLLRELTDESQTALILVTHSDEAAAICHRQIHLRDGRMTESQPHVT